MCTRNILPRSVMKTTSDLVVEGNQLLYPSFLEAGASGDSARKTRPFDVRVIAVGESVIWAETSVLPVESGVEASSA